MNEFSIVLSTFPKTDLAHEIAGKLVEEGLVACINICPAIVSIYKWENKICRNDEVLLIIKTTTATLHALEIRLGQLHPYKVFEFVVLPTEYVNKSYLEWVIQSCKSN